MVIDFEPLQNSTSALIQGLPRRRLDTTMITTNPALRHCFYVRQREKKDHRSSRGDISCVKSKIINLQGEHGEISGSIFIGTELREPKNDVKMYFLGVFGNRKVSVDVWYWHVTRITGDPATT